MKKLFYLIVCLLYINTVYADLNGGTSGNICTIYRKITVCGKDVTSTDINAADFEFIAVVEGTNDTTTSDYVSSSVKFVGTTFCVSMSLQGFTNSITGSKAIIVTVRNKVSGESGTFTMPAGSYKTSGTDSYTPIETKGVIDVKCAEPMINVTGVTLCDGATGTVNAKVKLAPAGYTIDWGDSHVTTGATTDTTAVGNVAAGLTVGNHNLVAKLKDASGNVMKDGSGNDIKANYVITVKANPTITLSATSVCKGEKVTFTASQGTTPYTWSGGTVSGTGNSKDLTCSTAGPKTYTVKVEDKNKCTKTETGTITVNDLPTVTVSTPKTDVCVNDPISLTATASGGSNNFPTYTWTNGATGNASGSASAKAGDNKFKVTVTDNKGCRSAASNEVNVVGHEVKTITIADAEACVGSAGTLSATVTFNPNGKQGTPTYTWTPAGDVDTGSTAASMTSIVYNAVGDHTFTLEVKDGHGCKATKTAKVKVKTCTTPEININNLEFCAGDQPGTVTANVTGITGYSIDWGVGNITSSANSSTGNISGTLAGGTYTAKLKDASGNVVDTKTYTVTVNPKPTLSTITASKNPADLNGTSNLSVTSNGTVTWSGSPIQGANTGLNITAGPFTAANTYTYTATAESAKGCEATANINITVAGAPLTVTPPSPTPTGVKNDPIPVCVTAGGGDCNGNYTYTWTSPDPTVTVTATTPGCASVTSTTSGNKNICVEVVCGKEKKQECFNVRVTEGDVDINLEWTITDKVCANTGENRTITLQATGGPAGTKYSFVLSDKNAAVVLPVSQQQVTTWTYTVTPANEGRYSLANFTAELPDGTSVTGQILPNIYIDASFDAAPSVYAHGVTHNSTLNHCAGDNLTLSGSGNATRYTWNNGVENGVPFVPNASGVYEVTGYNEFNCSTTDQVTVTVNPKPEVNIFVSGNEICPGEEVTLSATATLGATVAWTNGVTDGVPFRPDFTGVYTATATDPVTGCFITKDTTVVVKEKPVIVRHSKNPRNIAIGKNVYFAVDATGTDPLTYSWFRKVNGTWTALADNSINLPRISGTTTDSLVLTEVPESWDGSEFKVVVQNECDTASMIFNLGVKECFEIEVTLLMEDGIIPDTDPANLIDGWYCRGQRIAVRAVITSPEGYDIENTHYKWTIDGLDLPEEHEFIETDTAVLTWIPAYTEDDIVITVCGYCDGACEEVCPRYIRLKAREFEKISVDLLTSVDPEHKFCPGDTVDCWLATKNAGENPTFEWYNDIFRLPEEESPRNQLLSYEDQKITLVMGQEDTWVKVYMTPSEETCPEQPQYVDTVFLRKKEWVYPTLKIENSINDTLACRGDMITFFAIFQNAGDYPTFNWRKDIWDIGHESVVTTTLGDKDMWIKCELIPGNDVCFAGGKLIDTMPVRVLEDPSVRIFTDLTGKQPGDEIVIESEVTNMPSKAHYEWYINYDYTAKVFEPTYVSDKLAQGDVVQCAVSGENICQNRVLSNDLIIDFGGYSRDTMITIYQGEKIRNMNMRKANDLDSYVFRILSDGRANFGDASMSYDGLFSYVPYTGYVGSDMVKYEVVNKANNEVIGTGYIYIRIMGEDRYFIPNIITPNGDGLNDTWMLEFLSEFPDHLITVYNRDGKVVFQAKNYQNDWDGTGTTTNGYVSHFNLSNGIYTYVIDLGNKTILKNWLEIRRDMNRGKYKY